MQTQREEPKVAKISLNFGNSHRETATTKFVIIVTVFGIIFFIVLYLIIILKANNHINETNGIENRNSSRKWENSVENPQNSLRNPQHSLRNQQFTSKHPEISSKKPENSTKTLQISTKSSENQEKTEDHLIAESLISQMSKYPPRPFINNYRGPTPSSFHPTRPKPLGVTYAQLQNYNQGSGSLRNPHNIQDVIGFLMPSDARKKQNGLKAFWGTNTHDPFYSYKPKDPSDINLLATANLRFAPPAWKEIQSTPTSAPSQTFFQQEAIGYDQSQQNHATKKSRALTLTLNLFPMGNDPRQEHYYAVSSSTMSNVHRKMQPRKMVIHLNIYPNHEILNRGEEFDEDYFMEKNIIERSMNGLQQVLNKNEKLLK